jgi:acrylyl-CoA reductase (NADPH)
MGGSFQACVLRKERERFSSELEKLETAALPAGEVLVSVAWSCLNYKDGLALTGAPGVVRSYPMVPGIDLSGRVVESASPSFRPGDRVVLTGCGAGERFWGGYAEYARVPAEGLVMVPQEFSLRQAMSIGTAGFTAMMSVLALERHGVEPGGREVLVTGASGGVGSLAVAVLARLGYRVVAATRHDTSHEHLWALGAAGILANAAIAAPSAKPMESERWAGAIDSVGGDTLAGVLRAVARGGSVACCGLVGGNHLNTTVFPFILRGVNLLGINSVEVSLAERRLVWQRLARDLPGSLLDRVTEEIPLAAVARAGAEILKGHIRGRTVVRLGGGS